MGSRCSTIRIHEGDRENYLSEGWAEPEKNNGVKLPGRKMIKQLADDRCVLTGIVTACSDRP